MGDLNTISVENRARREQIERERREEERRKRELREKRRKQRMIKYYSVCTAVILLLLLIIFLVFNAVFCSSSGDKEQESTTEPLVEDVFNPSSYIFTEDMYIYDNTDEVLEMLDNLKSSKAELSDKVQFMIDNQAAYPEGLIKLVAKSPEAINFALEYPFKKGGSNSIVVDISADYTAGEIPLLLQWDDRWGYVTYGNDTISLSGCGPTCLSMVAVGLTGNVKWTPVRTARMAQSSGYYVEGTGTAWTLMYEGCRQMGISAKEIGLSEDIMVSELRAGHPIIASMGPGDFTDNGHFIVITDYEDGAFTVNDPNSVRNSNKTWTYESIKGQIKNMWSYTIN